MKREINGLLMLILIGSTSLLFYHAIQMGDFYKSVYDHFFEITNEKITDECNVVEINLNKHFKGDIPDKIMFCAISLTQDAYDNWDFKEGYILQDGVVKGYWSNKFKQMFCDGYILHLIEDREKEHILKLIFVKHDKQSQASIKNKIFVFLTDSFDPSKEIENE